LLAVGLTRLVVERQRVGALRVFGALGEQRLRDGSRRRVVNRQRERTRAFGTLCGRLEGWPRS
jgi:hypothetical protein